MKIGDLVTSRSPALRGVQGVVIDITEHEVQGRFDTGEIFVVLWNTGELDEYRSWDLTIEENL